MIPIKKEHEVAKMREACRIAANVLDRLCAEVAPGVNTYDLDQEGRKLIESYGAVSACYDYRVGGRRFPAFTCLSVNDEVVHGIGSLRRVLQPGDVITVDVCVIHDGWVGDNARTVRVGPVEEDIDFLLVSTEAALYKGIAQAKANKHVGDISNTIQRFIEGHNLGIVREFVGHGLGRTMHEEPQVPNFGPKGKGPKLKPGMTIAIEPMVTLGRPETITLEDGWTAVTRDGRAAAHYEHTVLITDEGPEILTIPDWNAEAKEKYDSMQRALTSSSK